MKKKLYNISKKILDLENIINNEKSLDKDIQSAKSEIEKIMSAISFEEILEVDDYIMSKKTKIIDI